MGHKLSHRNETLIGGKSGLVVDRRVDDDIYPTFQRSGVL